MLRSICGVLALLTTAVSAQDYGVIDRQKLIIGGSNRKVVMFIPKGVRKSEGLPLLVTIPETGSGAYREIGKWEQQGFEHKFAVVSVDIKSNGKAGWSPRDALVMARDMEAVEGAIGLAIKFAKAMNSKIDPSATVITAYSGGGYVTMWMGLRRPDLFLGIGGRSIVFHKETTDFGKLDLKPNLNQHIGLLSGEIDMTRSPAETQVALELLRKKGFRNVKFQTVPKRDHHAMPLPFLEWYYGVLKETAKGRKDARKVSTDLVKVQEAIDKKRAGAYGKLQKLVEREQRAGFEAGAVALMAEVMKGANKMYADAADQEANHDFPAAIATLKKIERTYSGLPISKKAREFASKIKKSDAFLAAEMLVKARKYKAKGKDIKASEMCEKIIKKYPETPAAEEAQAILGG